MEFKTAQDFLYQNYESHQYNIDNEIYYNERSVENMLIEFAKYHTAMSIKSIIESLELKDSQGNNIPDSVWIEFDTKAYPLDNIV